MKPQYLDTVLADTNLTEAEMHGAITHIMDGNADHDDIKAFLVGLHDKGETIEELTTFIEHKCYATSHAGSKINSCWPEDCDATTRHIFTTVVTRAFYHRMRAGVSNSETFTRQARGKQFATRSAIQTGITNDAGILASELTANRRRYHKLSARHAFTHVVIAIARQIHV